MAPRSRPDYRPPPSRGPVRVVGIVLAAICILAIVGPVVVVLLT